MRATILSPRAEAAVAAPYGALARTGQPLLVKWVTTAARLTSHIHAALHRIRAAIRPVEPIVGAGRRYRVKRALGVELDAAAFADHAREALLADASIAIPMLQAAMKLYGGNFLEDARAGDWHREYRDHLRRLYTDVAMRLGDLLGRADRHADAANAYRALVAREPLYEKTQRRLMTALARAGRRDDALRQYDRLVAVLRTELEAAPELETVALAARLRCGEMA